MAYGGCMNGESETPQMNDVVHDFKLPDLAQVPKIITCTIEGILEPEDLAAFLEQKASGAKPQDLAAPAAEVDDPKDLKRVREKHHSVARLIAAGTTQRLTATITGYSESYLSILLNNPAMQELVDYYRIQRGNAVEVVAEKLRAGAMGAVERLVDKMEADQLDANALLGLAKLGLDRSGHGPRNTTEVITESHVYDHAAIAELNRKAREGSKEYILDPQQVRAAALPALSSSSSENAEDADFDDEGEA